MNKNSIIKVLGVLLIIAVSNWYVDSQKLKDIQNRVRTEQTARSKVNTHVEDLNAENEDLTDQNKKLKDSQTNIKDGQQIKNNKFTLQYEDDDVETMLNNLKKMGFIHNWEAKKTSVNDG